MLLEALLESVELRGNRVYWREDRPTTHFNSSRGYATWKSNYAGKPVGSIGNHGYRAFTLSVVGRRFSVLEHVAAYALHIGALPDKKVDHKNGNRLDNNPANLQLVTDEGNAKNNCRRTDNTTGVTGVSYCSQTQRYRVQGSSNGITFRPKRVADYFEAICIRKSWEMQNGFTLRHGKQKEAANE